jgi:hypothetical protein
MRSLGGLISGVMGGAAKGYTEYAKQRLDVDIKKELMAAEEEKLLRIDEIKRQRDIRDIPAKGAAETAVQADRTTAVGGAETGVLANREDALRAGKAATTKATAMATGEAERENLAAYGSNANARAGARAKASDSESSATRAQAATTNFELGMKQDVAKLRRDLKNTKDPALRAELEQQIKDLSGSLTTKSYSDMVTAAESYRKMAANLRKDAENILEDDDRRTLLDRAQAYEREADAILQATKGQRLPGNTSQPVAGARPAAAASRPWERNWNTPGSGNVTAP